MTKDEATTLLLLAKDWPDASMQELTDAVNHAFSLDTNEHYTQASIWLNQNCGS